VTAGKELANRLQHKCNSLVDLIGCIGFAMKTQFALTFCVLVLSGCSESGAGRFLPTSPSAPNIALDSKTAQRCRLQGEPAAAIKRKNDLLASELEENNPDLAKQTREWEVLPLCSEIIAAEEAAKEKVKERLVTSLGFLLLLTFGIYMSIRHWRKKQILD
jgi:hypothetical protein